MNNPLEKNEFWKGRKGPLVLMIMDGVGYGNYKEGDAVSESLMPNFRYLQKNCFSTKLKAHGKAVGLPSDDDMGNSEVGHNAIGCGRVFAQGAKLVAESISSGKMFDGDVWKKLVSNVKKNDGKLHFLGLFSDGNVHSHIDHLKAMILKASTENVKKIRVHTLLDGRDAGEQSALEYIDPFEVFLKSFNDQGYDYCIASGGGRQFITMDRYGADWEMVRRGWECHVLGKGNRFSSSREAVEYYRKLKPGIIDQDMGEFVIERNGQAIGTIDDGDSVIFFNFRGDRALEITAAFEEENFSMFDRIRRPRVEYAGMMEYDGDTHVPASFLVHPPSIDRTMGEYFASTGIRTLAISETQKFGHVTYFFNGNRTGKFSETLEEYVEVPSDKVPFEERPWMKCAEITDYILKAIESGRHDFIRVNYPNGDMVGHTGVYAAVVCSMEALDLQLGRIIAALKKSGGILLLTSDHGNSDDMYEHSKKTGEVLYKADGVPKVKTSHTLNPVPCIIYDPEFRNEYEPNMVEGLGISSLSATCIQLLGYIPPTDYDTSVIKMK